MSCVMQDVDDNAETLQIRMISGNTDGISLRSGVGRSISFPTLGPYHLALLQRKQKEPNYHIAQFCKGGFCRQYLYGFAMDDLPNGQVRIVERAEHITFHCPRFVMKERNLSTNAVKEGVSG